jgi:hypothetical protein
MLLWNGSHLPTTQCACADFVDFAMQRNGGREKDLYTILPVKYNTHIHFYVYITHYILQQILVKTYKYMQYSVLGSCGDKSAPTNHTDTYFNYLYNILYFCLWSLPDTGGLCYIHCPNAQFNATLLLNSTLTQYEMGQGHCAHLLRRNCKRSSVDRCTYD